ncbi:MAG: barstar family protein [Chloroflexi bacterium]|nr:barstar family protein [Chloroflexota bacterium]
MLFANDLMRVTWQCVHFSLPDQEEDGLTSRLKSSGFQVFESDGSDLETKEHLFTAIAKAMIFPEYFGGNWDALHECLRDMEWLPAKGYVLFFRNAEQFWRRVPLVAGTFVEIWLSSAEEWSCEGVPFHLVFLW